jgi:catechol 2,3-dioxygenase-like lactoylglutathione lyase family enzyme
MQAKHIFETCLYAEDLVAAEAFYTRVLGLELVSNLSCRGISLKCGHGVVLIFDPRQTKIPHHDIPTHGCNSNGHMAFLVDPKELDNWRKHLQECNVAIESEVNWPEGGTSIYFRDPAGNSVELAPPTLWGFGGRMPS